MNLGVFLLGLVLLILGILASGYAVSSTNSYFFGVYKEQNVERPYYEYAWPLIIAGIVVMTVGAVVPSIVKTQKTIVNEEHPASGRRRTKTIVEEEEI